MTSAGRWALAAAMVAMTVACGADEQTTAPTGEPGRSATPAPAESRSGGGVTYRVDRLQPQR